jgi:L-methionine (R)-S-oxide reductase
MGYLLTYLFKKAIFAQKLSMATELAKPVGSKEEKYQTLLPQIKSIIAGEENYVANAANIVAALKYTFDFFWVGFYFKDENDLVLGPFQGELACTRIAFDKGVCGAAYRSKKTLLVPNVDEFPGHIACSAKSKSEIVVPILNHDEVRGVLDIDSDKLNDFDEIDQKYLEEVAKILENVL